MQYRIECNELQQSGTPYTLMLYLGKCRAPKCAQVPPGPWPHQAARGREETPVGMHGGLSTRLDARGRGRVRKSLARGRVRKSLAPVPRSRLEARGRARKRLALGRAGKARGHRISAQVAITRLKPRLCFPINFHPTCGRFLTVYWVLIRVPPTIYISQHFLLQIF